MITRQDLFEARTGGYWSYRVPGLLVTPNGAVLATAEARRGLGGDWDDNDILMRRSVDGGRTWAPPVVAVPSATYGPGPADNHVMLSDTHEGAVHVLYCHNYARVFYQRSDDDGAAFSDPVEVTSAFEAFRDDYPWRVCATGPGHGTQLRNGRLIVPVWLSDGSGTEFGVGKLGHRPSAVSLVYSDDHGRTWRRGAMVCRNGDLVDDEPVLNPSETLCVELTDGRVMFNLRNESERHRRLVSISPDGVSGWTRPRFDEALLEPICMGGLIRHSWPEGNRPGRILFSNPHNLEREVYPWRGPNRDRKNVTIKLSEDDGATWPISRVLEAGPSGYSDLGVLPDGTVLCIHERDIVERMTDDRCLTLAHFDLAWLTGGDA